MASHPYISGPGNISQTILLLRKNFPSTVTSETIKKYGIASNNESYVINSLQFIGLLDKDGKRTEIGHSTFSIHDDTKFAKSFESLIKAAYADLFDIRGEDAWSLSKSDLIGYFRTNDKTSELIASRQAGVFRVFASISGHGEPLEIAKPKPLKMKPVQAKHSGSGKKLKKKVESEAISKTKETYSRDMALTVRIEINLPAGASQETYDHIFKSIKANLLNE